MDNFFIEVLHEVTKSNEAFAVIVAIVLIYILLVELKKIEELLKEMKVMLSYISKTQGIILRDNLPKKIVFGEEKDDE